MLLADETASQILLQHGKSGVGVEQPWLTYSELKTLFDEELDEPVRPKHFKWVMRTIVSVPLAFAGFVCGSLRINHNFNAGRRSVRGTLSQGARCLGTR